MLKKHIIKTGIKETTVYKDGNKYSTRDSATFSSLEDITSAIKKDYAFEVNSIQRYYDNYESRMFNIY